MKKISIIIMLLIAFDIKFSEAQNLVPNPSFEDTIHCPTFPTPNIQQAAYWWPYRGTPDYFNSCANNQPFFGVPGGNIAGYQDAFIGNAYAGLATWIFGIGPPSREYMGAQLIQSLTIGTKYFVSCYISNADSAGANSSSNKFGFRFSTVSYSYFGTQAPINNFSHIHSNSVITDKINWTRISGSFIADSAYQYLALGNFYDNSQTLVDTLPPFNATTSYYYIDAVCVTTDSLYDVTWTSVGEINQNSSEVVFPNPADGEFVIDNNLSAKNFLMYNLLGQKIIAGQLMKGQNKVETSSLAAGMYLIFLDRKYFNKIIVQH